MGLFQAAYFVRRRGSMASRTASPKRFSPRTDTAMAQPGKMAIQGAFRMYFWESCKTFPQVGVGGGSPKSQEREAHLGQKDLGEIEAELEDPAEKRRPRKLFLAIVDLCIDNQHTDR
jgi:hypothetical protein